MLKTPKTRAKVNLVAVGDVRLCCTEGSCAKTNDTDTANESLTKHAEHVQGKAVLADWSPLLVERAPGSTLMRHVLVAKRQLLSAVLVLWSVEGKHWLLGRWGGGGDTWLASIHHETFSRELGHCAETL